MASKEDLLRSFLDMPALLAPQGVQPNSPTFSTLRLQILGVVISTFLLATLAVTIRAYTKLVILKKFGLEDYLISAAWILYTGGYNSIVYIMINMRGAGEHQWNLQMRDLIPFFYYAQVANIIYGLLVLLIKAAIIVQCLHVLVPTGIRTPAYWILHVLLWTHVIFYVIFTSIGVFACLPLTAVLDPAMMHGYCMKTMDKKALNIASAAINTASDMLLVAIPQIIIWQLNLPLQKKWAISLVFFVGLCACAAAAVRLYYFIDLAQTGDTTWMSTQIGFWVSAEVCCGFLVACTPVVPCFFKHKPISSALSATLQFLLHLARLRPKKYSREQLESSGVVVRGKEPAVIDIEFGDLVRHTDSV